MEFGREVFGVPGNVTQAVSFAPNLLIKHGAKLVTTPPTSSKSSQSPAAPPSPGPNSPKPSNVTRS